MAFLNINRTRFAYLLDWGTQDDEMKRFLKECQKRLIAKGARLDNLPHTRATRIRALEGLPRQTEAITKEWFSKNITMIDPENVDDLIGEFQLYEEEDERIPNARANRLARSTLVYLFSEQPPPELIKFLQSPIEGPTNPNPRSSETSKLEVSDDARGSEIAEGARARPTVDDTTLELIAALVEREDTDEIRDRLPGNTGKFVAGLLEAREGNEASAQSIADALPQGSKELQLLQRAIRHARMRPSAMEGARQGLEILVPEPYDSGFDPHSDAVIGYCTSDSGTSAGAARTAFVKPLAAVRGGRVELLSIAQKPVVFPEGGDIIAFQGARYPKQPTVGLIGAWYVARHETDRPAKFHLDRDFSRVYEMTRIPVHGSDPDAVRGYLKELGVAQKQAAPLQPRLYALGNGLIISPRSDSSDLSKDDAYDLPLPAWTHVEATILEGRTLVVGLPPHTTSYDCAPLAKTLRQLAKTIQERRAITNAQLRELIEAFDYPTIGLDKIRVRRVLDHLNEIVADRNALEELIPMFLEHPEVKQMIKVGIDAAVITKLSEQTDLHRQIKRLTEDRSSLEAKIKDLNVRHRRLSSETSAIVKSAFEKAVDAGFATLAQVEIFSALTGARHPVSQPKFNEREVASLPIEELPRLAEAEVFGRLKTLGIGRILAVGLLETVRIASRCGLAVCIRGTFAREIARTIACAFDGQGAAVDVEIGLIDSVVLEPLLKFFSTHDTVLLLDANLSALELYARKLFDRIIESRMAGEQTRQRIVLLGLSQSTMSLPLPSIVSRLSIVVDCDRDFEFDSTDSSSDLVQIKKTEEVAISAEALEHLRDEIGQVESALRPVVDRIIGLSLS